MPTFAAAHFDLRVTLECGQLFRFERATDRYLVRTHARAFCVRQQGDRLEYRGIDRATLIRFFRLDEDPAPMLRRLGQHRELAESLKAWRGLRLIRQDPWECLISFVSSSCCNIPRIQKMLGALCKRYGRQMQCGGSSCDGRCPFGDARPTVKAFPRPGVFNDPGELRALGFGYRAEYLAKISRTVTPQWLEALRSLEYSVARERLCTLPGVGGKVADCVLLFSLGFGEAFPIDVHVRRAALRAPCFSGLTDREIAAHARERYGADAGFAQQLLFLQDQNGK